MRAKEYNVLARAVEEGVAYGWRRAHKYVKKPEPEAIQSEIVEAVLGEVCEWFDFEEPPADPEESTAKWVERAELLPMPGTRTDLAERLGLP